MIKKDMVKWPESKVTHDSFSGAVAQPFARSLYLGRFSLFFDEGWRFSS